MPKVFFPSCLRKIAPTTLAHTLLGNMGNVAFIRGAWMTKTLRLRIPALDFTLAECLVLIAERKATMLYDNIYFLGHIFQMFLQDTPESFEHSQDIPSRGDASSASADVTLGSRLLEWLDKRNIVMDV